MRIQFFLITCVVSAAFKTALFADGHQSIDHSKFIGQEIQGSWEQKWIEDIVVSPSEKTYYRALKNHPHYTVVETKFGTDAILNCAGGPITPFEGLSVASAANYLFGAFRSKHSIDGELVPPFYQIVAYAKPDKGLDNANMLIDGGEGLPRHLLHERIQRLQVSENGTRICMATANVKNGGLGGSSMRVLHYDVATGKRCGEQVYASNTNTYQPFDAVVADSGCLYLAKKALGNGLFEAGLYDENGTQRVRLGGTDISKNYRSGLIHSPTKLVLGTDGGLGDGAGAVVELWDCRKANEPVEIEVPSALSSSLTMADGSPRKPNEFTRKVYSVAALAKSLDGNTIVAKRDKTDTLRWTGGDGALYAGEPHMKIFDLSGFKGPQLSKEYNLDQVDPKPVAVDNAITPGDKCHNKVIVMNGGVLERGCKWEARYHSINQES